MPQKSHAWDELGIRDTAHQPHWGKETVIMTASPTGHQHRKEVKIVPYFIPQWKNSWVKCKTKFSNSQEKMITASTLGIEGLYKTQSMDCKCYWWICLLKWGILNQKYLMVKPSKKVKSQVTNQEKLKCKSIPQLRYYFIPIQLTKI